MILEFRRVLSEMTANVGEVEGSQKIRAARQEYCQARGIRYQLAQSDTPIDDLLLKAMRTGGMWR